MRKCTASKFRGVSPARKGGTTSETPLFESTGRPGAPRPLFEIPVTHPIDPESPVVSALTSAPGGMRKRTESKPQGVSPAIKGGTTLEPPFLRALPPPHFAESPVVSALIGAPVSLSKCTASKPQGGSPARKGRVSPPGTCIGSRSLSGSVALLSSSQKTL